MRFAAPSDWKGALTFRVRVTGNKWIASSPKTSGRLFESNTIRLMPSPTSGARLTLGTFWADGTPCKAGIMAEGIDFAGRVVQVVVVATELGYELSSAVPLHQIRWRAADSLCSSDKAVVVPLATHTPDGRVDSWMPPGADLTIIVPGDAQHVLLETPDGARSVNVVSATRFRCVAPGRYSATLIIDGVNMTRSVDVGTLGDYSLDFSK